MVDTMSQGRLKIQHFAAGELIPALEGFDAVSKGTVEMNCANAYFGPGKPSPRSISRPSPLASISRA
jgi:TRAP-type mannitol/chloroaromatic compound transport system substrate-binding protein